jgi:hypothetical protein
MGRDASISKAGRAVRGLLALALLLGGAALGAAAGAGAADGRWALPVAVLAALAGAFCAHQARHGWCAVRAMGFRTPL